MEPATSRNTSIWTVRAATGHVLVALLTSLSRRPAPPGRHRRDHPSVGNAAEAVAAAGGQPTMTLDAF